MNHEASFCHHSYSGIVRSAVLSLFDFLPRQHRTPMRTKGERPIRSIPWSGRGKLFAGLSFLCLSNASLNWAQMPTATILGVVKDKSGAAVPGAAVTAHNLENDQS